MKRDVYCMETKLDADFENEVALLTWMIGALIVFAITNVGKQFFELSRQAVIC